MKRKEVLGFIGFFTILILFGILPISASSYTCEMSQVGERILINEKYNFDTNQLINIELPQDYSQIKLSMPYKLNGNNISLNTRDFEIGYLTSKYIFKFSDGFYFARKIIPVSYFDNIDIKLILDSGIVIKSGDVFPDNYELGTDGEKITIKWQAKNISKNQNVILFANLNDLNKSPHYFYYILLVILLIIIAFVYFKFYFKRKKDFEKHLIESEKKIIQELKKADRNEVWQKQLQNSSGFSKAKLSRIIRNLESRGLINKIPYGNTNKISLK